MKGIILAGGSGSRLAPLTNTLSKQLLPVYDKPMIYYPLSTLLDIGIRDILIISTPRDLPHIQALLGDGEQLGVRFTYKEQAHPNGIAECFLIAGDWIDEDVALILGDNIFVMQEERCALRALSQKPLTQATILLKPVPDPERFGVASCDEAGRVTTLIEKPTQPTSNLACVGLYFYPKDVKSLALTLTPSARGELEITDLNNVYLTQGRLNALVMQASSFWLDAGTPDALLAASVEMAQRFRTQACESGYIEVLAYKRGLIDRASFEALVTQMKVGTPYREHLRTLSIGRDQ